MIVTVERLVVCGSLYVCESLEQHQAATATVVCRYIQETAYGDSIQRQHTAHALDLYNYLIKLLYGGPSNTVILHMPSSYTSLSLPLPPSLFLFFSSDSQAHLRSPEAAAATVQLHPLLALAEAQATHPRGAAGGADRVAADGDAHIC